MSFLILWLGYQNTIIFDLRHPLGVYTILPKIVFDYFIKAPYYVSTLG